MSGSTKVGGKSAEGVSIARVEGYLTGIGLESRREAIAGCSGRSALTVGPRIEPSLCAVGTFEPVIRRWVVKLMSSADRVIHGSRVRAPQKERNRVARAVAQTATRRSQARYPLQTRVCVAIAVFVGALVISRLSGLDGLVALFQSIPLAFAAYILSRRWIHYALAVTLLAFVSSRILYEWLTKL